MGSSSLFGPLLCGLLLASPAVAAPVDPAPFEAGLDWQEVGAETAALLSAYLQSDDTNPPGRETRGALLLAHWFAELGLPSTIYEFAPGRGSLLVRLPADTPTQPPLCLLSHIDVVEAEADRWERPPLSGEIADGHVWGRGALDMKGMGAIEAMTMALLVRQRVALQRDVIFLAVADEEVDNQGIRHMVEHWEDVGCSHVVNEGGMGLQDALFEGQTILPISVGEKGFLWGQLVAEGEPGHGSTPVPDTAPERLVAAYQALAARKLEVTWDPSVYALLHAVGEHHGGVSGWVLRHPALVRLLVKGQLMDNPLTRAILIDTVNITGFSGAKEPNVVPSRVQANVDSRLLPGTDPDEMADRIEQIVADAGVEGVRFEPTSQMKGAVSPWDDPFYAALARRSVEGLPGAVAGPALSPGFTDSIYLRELGVRAYGMVPFIVTEADLRTMHGDDERVSIENLERGTRALWRAVLDVAADPRADARAAREPVPFSPELRPARPFVPEDLTSLPADAAAALLPSPTPDDAAPQPEEAAGPDDDNGVSEPHGR